ncbi:uncharacterized protein LOC135825953 [Sycon ciliatum]|uniref:uncharacterized protein LOC135825953 n=1 Tax=Sycon ciliatum TaxID=27933 RepID=UPI0031F6C42A
MASPCSKIIVIGFAIAFATTILAASDSEEVQGGSGTPPNSCFVQLMLHAGIDLSDALAYEGVALDIPLSLAQIETWRAATLAWLLNCPTDHVVAIQDCIAGRSTACSSYPGPCFNSGQCLFTTGLDVNAYVCRCPTSYSGQYCQDVDASIVHDVAEMQRKIKSLEKSLDKQANKTALLGSGCNLRTLGYKYQSRHNLFDHKDRGQLASITFIKKRTDTVLKLSYSSNIRTRGARKYLRWFFKIDGKECRQPTPIDIGMRQDTNDNTHVPAVLTGICESIAKNGASLSAGHHNITVHVGQLSTRPIADGHSQWHTTSILEVQEMCPQF